MSLKPVKKSDQNKSWITDWEHMEIQWNFKDEVMEFIQG